MELSFENIATLITLSSSIIGGSLTALVSYFTFRAITQNKLETQDEKLKNISEDIKEIRDVTFSNSTRIATIEGYFQFLTNTDFIKRNSPIDLTPKGQQLLDEIAGDEYLESNLSELIDSIRSRNPLSPYDIQQYCFVVLSEKVDSIDFKSFKDYAFHHGLDLLSIIQVLSIHLRNKIIDAFDFNDGNKTEEDTIQDLFSQQDDQSNQQIDATHQAQKLDSSNNTTPLDADYDTDDISVQTNEDVDQPINKHNSIEQNSSISDIDQNNDSAPNSNPISSSS